MAPTTTTAGRTRGGDRSGWGTALRPRLATALAVALFAALLAAPPNLPVGDQLPAASHAAGVLDPTFDTDGIATTEISSEVNVADAAVEVIDGTERVLVLDLVNRVWRFLPDGSLDTTFDDDGVLPLGLSFDARELALGPSDGTFVVAAFESGTGVHIARFATDDTGTRLDTSFGTDGVVTIAGGQEPAPSDPCSDAGEQLDRTFTGLADLGVQSNGEVIVVGPGDVDIDASFELDCSIVTRDGIVAARTTAPDAQGDPTVVGTSFSTEPLVPGSLTIMEGAGLVDHVVVSASAAQVDIDTSEITEYITSIRYEPDLELDTTFGPDGDGFAELEEQDRSSGPKPVVTLADGTVGVLDEAEPSEWRLFRWASDGDALPTTATAFDEPIDSATAGGLALTADQGFVATGSVGFPSGTEPPDALAVARYGADGGNIGTDILHHPGPPEGQVSSFGGSLVRFDAADSFLVADAVRRPTIVTFQQLRLTRLGSDGQIDPPPTADADGFVTHHGAGRATPAGLNSGESGRAVEVMPDGRIATGGRVDDIGISTSTTPSGFLLRHETDGPLDQGFSPDPLSGILVPGFDTSTPGVIEALALDTTGRSVVAGWAGVFDSVGVVNRVLADGSADPSFNPDAAEPDDAPVIIDLDDDATALHDVVIDDRGRIVAVGESMRSTSSDTSVEDIVVVRLLADGDLDPDFGSPGEPGVARIPPPASTSRWRASGRGIALDPTGRIVITGWIQRDPDTPQRREVITARLGADGDADATFGSDPGLGDGVRLGPDGTGEDVATDGSTVVVSGQSESAGFVSRRTEAGGLDPDFGTGGTVRPFGTDAAGSSTASSVEVDAVGNYVVTGDREPDPPPADDSRPDSNLVVARVLSSGELDTVFGDDGVTTTDLGLAADEWADDVAIAPDGRIVAAGGVSDDRSTRVLVARYLPGETTLECTPATVDLDTVEIGDSASGTATCTAVGGTVVIGDPVISPDPTSANPFALPAGTCQDATLFPGESCDLTVAMTPFRSGTSSATLEVAHQTVTGPATTPIGLQATTPGPSLVLDPTEGPIETEVEATGSDFDIGVDVELSIAGTAVATVPAGDLTEGGFTTTFEVPVGTPGGPQPVTACQRCGTTEEVVATATFEVTPRLFVTPSVARPGNVVSARGDGFPSGATVFLDWEPGLGRVPVTADSAGTFTDVAVLVFRRDVLGARELEAFVGGASEAAATAPLLAVPGSSQPRDFATRR